MQHQRKSGHRNRLPVVRGVQRQPGSTRIERDQQRAKAGRVAAAARHQCPATRVVPLWFHLQPAIGGQRTDGGGTEHPVPSMANGGGATMRRDVSAQQDGAQDACEQPVAEREGGARPEEGVVVDGRIWWGGGGRTAGRLAVHQHRVGHRYDMCCRSSRFMV